MMSVERKKEEKLGYDEFRTHQTPIFLSFFVV